MGHVRDLPKSKLGVDVKKGFKPEYRVLASKRKVMDELKKAAEKAEALYVATDPDREGEAIGWHLAQELKVTGRKVFRVTFNEITARAIKAAFAHPGKIDLKKVEAQQARRVLDRLVGYNLSPLLWRKVQRGLSAGRVQSVAVRLITDREREIQAFVPVEYWSIEGEFKKTGDGATFDAKLNNWKGKALDKMGITSKKDADAILDAIKKASWKVSAVTEKEKKASPPPPFTTSTLQQAANTRLGFTSKQTMTIAQHLYEGIELGTKGQVGLITYMRTDSVSLSDKFTGDARSFLTKEYGDRYALPEPRRK